MLTFTTHDERHYNAIGVYGTHYTITEDRDDEPILYYVEDMGLEFTTYTEAVAHCNLCEECESITVELVAKGLKAYFHNGEPCDFIHSGSDDAYYVYCPTAEVAKLFCEWTEKAMKAYQLDYYTDYSGYGGPCLYKIDCYRYEEMDKALAWIIANNK